MMCWLELPVRFVPLLAPVLLSLQVRTTSLSTIFHLNPSLYFRERIGVRGEFPFLQTENPVARRSDMAGEVVTPEREDVTDWKLSERVCSNLAINHLLGYIPDSSSLRPPG